MARLRTVLALLVLILRTPGFLAGRAAGLRHRLMTAFALACVPVLVWWAYARIVSAVVDLAARAAGLTIPREDVEGGV